MKAEMCTLNIFLTHIVQVEFILGRLDQMCSSCTMMNTNGKRVANVACMCKEKVGNF